MKKQQPQQKQQPPSKLQSAISLLQLKRYGCLTRIFCCKCFYCCQDFDFTLLTSKNRKGAFQDMVRKYLKSMHNSTQPRTNIIMDPFFMLVALLLGQQSQIYNQLLQQVSNHNQTTIFSKQDLQFYIPQLCTYLVFHEEMSNIQLSTFLERACKVDLHFSLRYYFFMKSLEMIESTYEVKKLAIVEKYNLAFRNKINLCHKLKTKGRPVRKGSINEREKEKPMIDQEMRDKEMRQREIRKKSQELQRNTKAIQMIQVGKDDSFMIDQKFQDHYDKSINKLNPQQYHQQSTNPQQKYRKDSLQSSYSNSNSQDFQHTNNQFELYKSDDNKFTPSSTSNHEKLTTIDIKEIYTSSVGKDNEHYPLGLFESTANFYNDLVHLSQLLLKLQGDRNKNFQHFLIQMNDKLPSIVYIPFTKNDYQGLNILNIIIKQSRVFKTKQRAPFKICFQTYYNPNTSDHSSREKKIKSTINSSQNLKRSVLFEQDIQLQVQGEITLPESKNSNDTLDSRMSTGSKDQKQKAQQSNQSSGISESKKTINFKEIKKNIWGKLFQLKKLIKDDDPQKQSKSQKKKNSKSTSSDHSKSLNASIDKHSHGKMEEQNMSENQSTFTQNQQQKLKKSMTINEEKSFQARSQMITEGPQFEENQENDIFGPSQTDKFNTVAEHSPYSRLPGYKIISIMVKSNDDLRQQCFAMQLLYEFQRIFSMEKLKIRLCPYEVMPLSHNSGIIEFISESVTIDELMKMHGNLMFVRKSPEKLKNFIHSLAGYSLVTYMLQVKDRHNQNIMIRRDGTIVHIDFGFFLSNMPGKGVELQKKVPFKLTYQYIDALGGVDSKQFSYFRKLFYQGFNALRKHQHRILILTKLMYSSYGTTMKCFEKGDEAIEKLVNRFNPKNVRTDGELSLFCQTLVNESIQNWRAKWYDRWQYFAQGIVY